MMRTAPTNSTFLRVFRHYLSRQTFFGAVVCLVLAACTPPRPATVSLRVTGNVRDAHVTIDDQYLGAFAYVAKKGVALPPGPHRITVEKSGYFAWDKVVVANEGDPPIKLEVILVEIPD
ncbi:MAG TPA: PEGA domain-containing protein [Polyangium sp.]|nr:PEGA domain-containing protein [Polyangium sp.]